MTKPTTAHPPDVPTSPDRRAGARWLVRLVVLAAAALVLLPQTGSWGMAVLVPALSPLVAVASVLGTWTIPWTALVGLAVGAAALARRRWFCRWVCPTGMLADLATRAGLRWSRRCPRLPPLGQAIAAAAVGGACLGYPVVLWLDPLAWFSAPFSLLKPEPPAGAGWLAIGIVAVLLASAAWPGIWCARLCPLGATLDLCYGLRRIAGPARAWRGEPSGAQQVPAHRSAGAPVAAAHRGPSRRLVLGALAGVAWAAGARTLRAGTPNGLRPPGARDETRFVGLCVRCGNCARACPANIIAPDLAEHGLAGLLAPVLDFRHDYCREDCARCTQVCPSGALARVTVQHKQNAVIGLARVDMDLCLLRDSGECSACRNHCPYDAIRYVWSDTDYATTPQIDPSRCPGCGACQVACPTTPAKAIVVRAR